MKKGSINIGTSGWHYKHWKGNFYPKDIKPQDQLAYYAQYFSTVELNNSFYMLPASKSFQGWHKESGRSFVFTIKASRFITHLKKLNVDRKSIRAFFSHVDILKNKKGPLLFQLPPGWKINLARLETFLKMLPKKNRYAFEFRNHTWYDEEVYALLEKYNASFCIYELHHHISPLVLTADFVYVRLHGPGNRYEGSYSDSMLKKWARNCLKWQKQGRDVYVYFDNDQAGYAAFNALRLMALTGVETAASSEKLAKPPVLSRAALRVASLRRMGMPEF